MCLLYLYFCIWHIRAGIFFNFKNKANDLNKCTEINETRKCECNENMFKK